MIYICYIFWLVVYLPKLSQIYVPNHQLDYVVNIAIDMIYNHGITRLQSRYLFLRIEIAVAVSSHRDGSRLVPRFEPFSPAEDVEGKMCTGHSRKKTGVFSFTLGFRGSTNNLQVEWLIPFNKHGNIPSYSWCFPLDPPFKGDFHGFPIYCSWCMGQVTYEITIWLRNKHPEIPAKKGKQTRPFSSGISYYGYGYLYGYLLGFFVQIVLCFSMVMACISKYVP